MFAHADVVVLKNSIEENPLWSDRSRVTKGDQMILAVEVISTNWRTDYITKVDEYEAMGVPEYWIVDYLGLAAARYIGKGKQPTLTIYQLVNGKYQSKQFRGDELIVSLSLTANQVFLVSNEE